MGHDDEVWHVTPVRTYLTVYAVLVTLTIATVLTASIDLGGHLNIVVAMLIASIKASLVFLWFMHLKHDGVVNRVIFGAGFFFLLLLFLLTAADKFFKSL